MKPCFMGGQVWDGVGASGGETHLGLQDASRRMLELLSGAAERLAWSEDVGHS